MTFDTSRKKLGRRPVLICELDLDRCANVYGTAPCTATGAPGFECYNTRGTCQDVANFTQGTPFTYRLSKGFIEGDGAIPAISSGDLAPTVLDPSRGLGLRASIKIQFDDFPHHDRPFDPYAATRTYNPEDQGTFFGKMIARNRFYIGRPMRILSGYINDPLDPADFQTRNYVIDSITGPDGAGRVTITGKDILKLADDKRAKVPEASTGKTVNAMTPSSTSLTVTAGTESEYDGSEYLTIGDEIILAPFANRAANVFSNLTRAEFGTTADDHQIDATVQSCYHMDGANVIDVVRDMLINYAGIDASFIDNTAWDAERDQWYSSSTITTVIPEVRGVTEVINELAEQYFFQIWWNEIDQEIILKAIVPPLAMNMPITLDDESGLIVDKTRIDTKDERRLTRVLFYYNPRTPIDITEPEDFDNAYILLDADAEGADQYGDVRTLVIFGGFVKTESLAVQTAGRMLGRFLNTPRYATAQVDAKDIDAWTGEFIYLESKRLQSIAGAPSKTLFQIMSAKELIAPMPGTTYEFKMLEANFAGRYGYIGPDTLNDYPVESDANKAAYGFIAPDNGGFADGQPPYKII